MTAPRGTTQACPACDDTDIRQRLVDKHDSRSDPDAAPWVCEDCGNEFDDPVTRTRQSLGGRRGLAGQLARADPDDGDLVTDGGTVEACPECDTAAIERRTPSKAESPASQTHRWYCRNCGASFDEPVERAPITSTTTLSGLSADLDAADPDAIPDGGVPDPDAFRMPTVAELDAMRVAKGLSQRDLSRRAGCEQSRFNTILNKDIDPHASTLRAFLTVLQEAEGREDDEIERTGPKPRPSPNADPDPEDFELLSAQLHHSPPDVVGEDPRPPERERDDGLWTDGGPSYCAACHRAVAREDRVKVGGEVYHRQCAPDEAVANRQFDEFVTDGGQPVHHGVCRDCPDEWVGEAQSVHRDAEIHSLAHGHRTEVQQIGGDGSVSAEAMLDE